MRQNSRLNWLQTTAMIDLCKQKNNHFLGSRLDLFRGSANCGLHPLIHTLLEFDVGQSVVGVCEGGSAIADPAF